jgi:hypothetical protein
LNGEIKVLKSKHASSSVKESPAPMAGQAASSELVSKPRLRPDSGVADLLKMLTYDDVCGAFSSARALASNLIRGFETSSIKVR